MQKQPPEVFHLKRCSTGKQPCQSLFSNKVAGLRPATLLKMTIWHRYFPMNFTKFLRNTEHLWTTASVDVNIEEQHWSVNEECFYVNNLTPSIKHLVWDYSHKKQALLALQSSWTHTVHILQSNLLDFLLKSVYKRGKLILVCQHYFLFLTKLFEFICFYWLFWFRFWFYLFVIDLIFLLFLVLFFFFCFSFFVRRTSNDFRFTPILIRKIR